MSVLNAMLGCGGITMNEQEKWHDTFMNGRTIKRCHSCKLSQYGVKPLFSTVYFLR